MSDKSDRRRALAEAARDVILRFGYRKTTLEDIAREARVSRATIYNYFPGKEAILRTIVQIETDRLEGAMRAAVDPEDPPAARLRALVRARYAHLRQIRALYAVVIDVARELLPAATDLMDAFQARQVEAVVALLREGEAAGCFRPVDAPLFAQALLSALRGLDEAYMFDHQESTAEGALLLLDTLLLGLRTQP